MYRRIEKISGRCLRSRGIWTDPSKRDSGNDTVRMYQCPCISLPKYRGAAPIQWAVINGEKVSGVTTMQMDEGLDTGDMLEKVEITLDKKKQEEAFSINFPQKEPHSASIPLQNWKKEPLLHKNRAKAPPNTQKCSTKNPVRSTGRKQQ